MRITVVLLTVALLQVSAKAVSQKISFKGNNVTLQKVFSVIEKQTGYVVFYDYTAIKSAKNVNLNAKETPLDEFLKLIFKDQPFNFVIEGKTILISPKNQPQPLPPGGGTNFLADTLKNVHGKVTDESGKPAVGVSVKVKGTNKGTTTNDNGEFILTGIDANAILVFSSINMETNEMKLNGRHELSFEMKTKISQLADITIEVNTGYQSIPKERATGSFVQIDSSLINRNVSTNILDRLENITSGLVFNKNLAPLANGQYAKNQSLLTIRGRSTINSNPNPLVIVDNFPYDGDLSTINPDDVLVVTILKDAAAASIWGAYSGNGVIVITTKKGKYNQPLKVTLNSSITVTNKPDLFYASRMSSSEYVDLETFLFSKGNYASPLSNVYSSVSPVVQILANRKAGLISVADSANLINVYRNIDIRNDLSNYFYQKAINQHYDINLSGGNSNNKYFFSTGFDNNNPNLTYNSYQRIVLKAGNTFKLINDKLEFSTDFQFSQSITNNNNSGAIANSFPYLQLVDGAGNALNTVNTIANIRQSYVDTVGQGKLLDWNYRPYDEIRRSNNTTKLLDYHLNLSARYILLPGLNISALYNYNKGISDQQNYQSPQTFLTRTLINQYSQINYSAGIITRPVPLGGILDRNNNTYESQNIRGVIEYTHNWKGGHNLNILAGVEVRKINGFTYTSRVYGYDPFNTTFTNVDFANTYVTLPTKSNLAIPSNVSNAGTTNNFISYYTLIGYNYLAKYGITLSGRKDEANIYGVNSNLKGLPLFSGGIYWDINKERFYHVACLPFLKIRVTDGYQGNNNSSVAALTTIRYASIQNNYGAAQASVSNLPNPDLQWERVNQFNIGVDFGFKDERVTGTLEYFTKQASGLLIPIPVDPTSGASSFTTNAGSMRTNGLDVSLTTKNISNQHFEWKTKILLSYAKDHVTNYLIRPSTVSQLLNQSLFVPLVGNPLYSAYAFRWDGLDTLGNPQVMLDGKVNQNYSGAYSSTNLDNAKYMGPINPTVTGSILNSFRFGQFDFSFLISYKLGYYFIRPSVNYNSLFVTSGGNLLGSSDYANRWKNPGDEKLTNVPALIYPSSNSFRDAAYAASDILVDKGDYIRLQDVQVAYSLNRKQIKNFFFQGCQLYIYMSNLGIIWRANKDHIDPDFIPSYQYTYPALRSISAGVKLSF